MNNHCATIKMPQAVLDGMRFLRDLNINYFINMTGQCYPLKPISLIEKQLSDGLSHMEFAPIPGWELKGENGGLDRINYRWYILLGRMTIRIPRIRKSLPENMKPYGGAAWLCLRKTHMDYIVDYLASHPNVLKFHEHVKIPEEQVFQTVLMNSPFAGQVLNRLEWYVDWRKGGGHPAILTVNHIPDLLTCNKLFARKFDDDQLFNVIDALNPTS